MKYNNKQNLILVALVTLAGTTLGTPCTTDQLETAAQLTRRTTYIAQVKTLTESGTATNEKVDALKVLWLEQKNRGLADLEHLIPSCERQAKDAESPLEAARYSPWPLKQDSRAPSPPPVATAETSCPMLSRA